MLGSAQPTRPAVLARWGLAVALAAAAFVVAVPASAQAAATTLTVSTTADVAQSSGACADPTIVIPPVPLSLREASCVADNLGGAVTITIPAGTYTLTGGELRSGAVAGQNVTFVGAGSSSTVITAGGASRVFNLDPNVVGGISTTISGVTITDGADSTFGGAGIIGGSGALSTMDSLTLAGVNVSDNHANDATPTQTDQPGGGVQFLGGALTVTGSTFSQNTSQSSAGAAIAYETDAAAPNGRLSIDGTTFQGNSTTNTSTDSSIANGGAVSLRGIASATSTITNSRFLGNSATSTSGPAVGAALWSQSGNVTVSSSTFTGNTVSGGAGTPTGGAIEVEGGTAAIDHSRLVGNTATSGGALGVKDGATVTATENWWGCNAGPGSSGCDTVSGSAVTTPRLVLTASADPSTVTGPDAAATIAALMTVDSDGTAVPSSSLGAFSGLTTSFAVPAGDASVSAPTATIAQGVASVDYDSHTVSGPNSVNVTLDNQTVAATLTVFMPLAFTSADSTSFQVGVASSFTVTTSGYPVVSVATTSPLPTGVSLVFNEATDTATLSGTAAAGTAGTYPIALVASNGSDGTVTQNFTLTVGGVPTFTSASTATFTVGVPSTFAIAATGTPTPTSITKAGGALPDGLTLSLGNSDGTIFGTPAAGTGGSYPITLHASNGVLPDATQTLTVQVNEAPTVTTNPATSTVAPGDTATFTAAASGTPTPTVQWQSNTGSGFTNIAGATSTTYSFTTAATDNGTVFRAVFTNSVSSATTSPATLRVGSGPTFTSASSSTFTVGTAGSFAVTTAGTPTPTTITKTAGVLPLGLTFAQDPLGGPTATLSGTPAAGTAGTYAITLTASNGFVPNATQTLTLTVDAPPVVTTQPSDATVAPGATATFTAAASGAPTPTVQWQSNPGSGFADIAGATSGTLSVATAETDNGTTYRAVFTSTLGTATTSVATLHVGTTADFTSPGSAAFTIGTAGSLTVTTDGTPTSVISVDPSSTLPSWLVFTPGRVEAGGGGAGGGAAPAALLRAAVAAGDPGTATLSGTPPTGSAGTYRVKLLATNGIGAPVAQTVTIVVAGASTPGGPGGPGTGGNPGGGAPGSGSGGSGGSGTSGGTVSPATGILAFTGSLVNPYVALGGTLVLVLGGLALLLVRRRRQLGEGADSE